jgi:hypothetical protein
VRILPRLLYTTYEFSYLPMRNVGCSGCSPARSDCDAVQQHGASSAAHRTTAREGSVAARRRAAAARSFTRIFEAKATALSLNISRDPICGRTSYVGEDGSRDAFEGLVEVLRLRLHAPESEAEPWDKDAWGGPSKPPRSKRQDQSRPAGLSSRAKPTKLSWQPRWPLPRSWFRARAAYYAAAAATTQPVYTLLQGVPPSLRHRKAQRYALHARQGVVA